jgi:hypothetical protein
MLLSTNPAAIAVAAAATSTFMAAVLLLLLLLLRTYTHLHSPWKKRVALLRVFLSSMAIVMGPTPPGTGVMAPATCLHSSKAQSPTSLQGHSHTEQTVQSL